MSFDALKSQKVDPVDESKLVATRVENSKALAELGVAKL